MRRNSNGVVSPQWPLRVLRDRRRGTKGKLIVSENPPSGADGSYNRQGTRRSVLYRTPRFKARDSARHNTNPWFCRSCTFCLQQKRRVTLLVNHRIYLSLSLYLSWRACGRCVEKVISDPSNRPASLSRICTAFNKKWPGSRLLSVTITWMGDRPRVLSLRAICYAT